ncbi:hypothetical protein IU449_26955 [Nocardia higoensis]|uniref:Uncharacterized protein n=1 Tax=Nocardia higoensis TaxID=228599 RepID=A0ABS0DI52_9NOCA|nr:hypothetical protein [Nocardia higoensis]MBF6358140.1 hypothetical protein [Nocardia higoensis]
MTTTHNIPLMRKILRHIDRHPFQFAADDFTRDILGWAVKLSDTDWAHVDPDAGYDAVELVNYRTGQYAHIAVVGAQLLGTTAEETEHLMYISRRACIDWLNDAINIYENRVIDAMEKDLGAAA